jgi:hypothetical protein
VFKLDQYDNTLWVRQNSSFNTSSDNIFPSIAIDCCGNAHIYYSTNGTASGQIFSGISDIVVFKLDHQGEILWIIQQPSFNTTLSDHNPNIAIDSCENTYMTYNTNGLAIGQTKTCVDNIVVFKLDQ